MKSTNESLDLIRACAALLVVLGHAKQYYFLAQSASLPGWSLDLLLLTPATLAREAVAIFFVLSGFLVGGQVLRHSKEGRFSWADYLLRRLSRLWTVLIPGLIVVLLVDSLTSTLLPGRSAGPVHSRSLVSALCQVAFLQQARCETYGSNDALWSLAYEFWFYILFAAAALAVRAAFRRSPAVTIAHVLVAIVPLLLFGFALLTLIPAWLIGAAVAWLDVRFGAHWSATWSRKRILGTIAASILLLALALFFSNLLRPNGIVQFAAVGAAAAPLILILAISNPSPRWRLGSAGLRYGAWIGSWSFSIYVFHLPVVRFLALMAASLWSVAAVPPALPIYALAAVAVILARPLWAVSERWTPAIREAMWRMVVRTRLGELPLAYALESPHRPDGRAGGRR